MRTFATPVIAALISVSPFGVSATAQQSPSSFDTAGFLSACTGFVPNVELAIPMDAECVSLARRMCDLAKDGSVNGACLDEVTDWMAQETRLIWWSLPVDRQSGYTRPTTYQDIMQKGLAPELGLTFLDCASEKIPGLSTQTICAYADALYSWHGVRVIQRVGAVDASDHE